LGHDIAYPAMLRFLPTGWIGLMLGGLVAANSSTILTHLNWGASYLVHDFYRRFVTRDATEKHYVLAGRYATVLLFVLSSAMVFALDTAKDSFNLLLQVGAGTGLLYLLRWFWWRITAWCEIVAMISSVATALVFRVLAKNGVAVGFSQQLIIGVAVTTISWLIAAYMGPQTDPAVLISFYRKVHPFGPGWRDVRAKAGVPAAEAALEAEHQNIPLSLVGWIMGCMMIWSALFTVGNFLYGRTNYALALGAVFVVSGSIVIRVVQRLWK
jgi:SSS family solute:Na+ symporter